MPRRGRRAAPYPPRGQGPGGRGAGTARGAAGAGGPLEPTQCLLCGRFILGPDADGTFRCRLCGAALMLHR
eukprot:5125397-Alexandrium_andersonii.AAC.1